MKNSLKPAHQQNQLTVKRGKVKLTCICGWQSSAQEFNGGEGLQTVLREYDEHVGLREKF